MSFLALLSLLAICLSCGQNYRLPIIQIPGDPGDPKLYHFAMTISTNDPTINSNIPGTVMQVDVVGDMDVGEAPLGRGPVHATLLPTGSANRIYVANGLEDTVSTTTAAPLSCSPGPVCPIGVVSTITMPAGSTPSYLNSTEASNMYVILSGATPPSIGVISVFQNALTKQIPFIGASNLAAMVELPNGRKLYVVDQGNSSVYVVDTASRQIVQTLAVGAAPSMALASPDNSAVYVMTNSGVSVIDALTDQVIAGNLSTGGQPNSITYDAKLLRLYLTDTSGGLGVYDTAVAAGNLPNTLVVKPAGFVPGAMGVAPLPNGHAFYVLGTTGGTSLTLTGYSSTFQLLPSLLPKAPNPYTLDFLNPGSDLTTTPPTVVPMPPVAQTCSGVRFRYMAGASADSARVYVSSCDAGGTYIFRTSDNTGVLTLPSPNQPPVNGTFPRQNPVFLITGR
jgi:YVTN family beta-propeller protein